MKQIGLVIIVFFLSGCFSLTPEQKEMKTMVLENQNEDPEGVVTAFESVVESYVGQNITPEQAERVVQQLKTDKEAQSAVIAIKDGLDPSKVRVKYSPATGKRYSASMEFCPETGVKLLPVE